VDRWNKVLAPYGHVEVEDAIAYFASLEQKPSAEIETAKKKPPAVQPDRWLIKNERTGYE
jgi:hypothetical protein